MKIQAINEPKLLGTAGTLLRNRRFFKGYTGLLIHADNMMEDGLDDFITAHHDRQEECILTMLTFETDSPSSCGIVEIDEKRVVQGFHEKIQYPPGNEVNGAPYAFDENFIESLSMIKPEPSDFSTEAIPKYLGRFSHGVLIKIYGYRHTESARISPGNQLGGRIMSSKSNMMSFEQRAYAYLERIKNSFNKSNIDAIENLARTLKEAWINGKNVFICGNGGSAANAIHMANDFHYGIGACGAGKKLPGLRVEALSANQGIVTCLANDIGYENIYAHQLEVKARKGDVLLILSGSGNSSNICKALTTSKNWG